MLIATCMYFLLQDGPIYIVGDVVCVLCFLAALYLKIDIDQKFKRGLSELARGKCNESSNLALNPAFTAGVEGSNSGFLQN